MKRTITTLKYVCFLMICMQVVQACDKTPVVKNTGTGKPVWLTELNAAYEASVKEKKLILVYFTEQDTCGKCVQLERDYFSTPVFQAWADKNVVLMKIYAPSSGQHPTGNEKQNLGMIQSLKVTTYPTLWMLSVTHEVENGRFKVKPIGFTGFQPSVEKLIGSLQNLLPR